MSSLLDAALSYTAHGLSVIPTSRSKAPFFPLLPRDQEDKPVWTPYLERIATVTEINEWAKGTVGFGIIGGTVSAGLTILDFDVRDGVCLFDSFSEMVAEQLPTLLPLLPIISTQRGGRHIYFRCTVCNETGPLAHTAKGESWIDTKAQGGYCVAPPSPGYDLIAGSLDYIPTITPEEREILMMIGRSFDASPLEEAAKPKPIPGVRGREDSPADRFRLTHGISDMLNWLTEKGWTYTQRHGHISVTRPGKDLHEGSSATLGRFGIPLLFVFSTSAHPFTAGRSYSAFSLWAALYHGGDEGAASRAILRSEPKKLRNVHEIYDQYYPPEQEEETPEQEKQERKGYRIIRGGLLEHMPEPKELIEGWVLKAPTALLYAKAGVGKTFLAMDMALCIASGKPWHGHEVMKGPVIYIAAEGAYGMGQRYVAWCQAYNGGENVEDFCVIPHPVFPTYEETFAKMMTTIEENNVEGLQAIFLDTMAQCFGEGNENDNHDSQVFLSSLTTLAQATGATVFIVHHEGWEGTRLRGASNFRNSVDTVMQIKEGSDPHHFTLKHDKIKDRDLAQPLTFERVAAERSCFIRPVGRTAASPMRLTPQQEMLLRTMITPSLNGSTASVLMKSSGIPESSFHKVLGELARGSMITSTGQAKTKDRTHTITEGGKKALARLDSDSIESF